uniref:Uncharacterized protein n=1 Tax=Anguilla anguilla TaxID=7936 RepID=A0A0E9PRV7_ANGAN
MFIKSIKSDLVSCIFQ